MMLTIRDIFEDVLEAVCTKHNLAWWDIVDSALWEKEAVPYISESVGIPVTILETMKEFTDWYEDLLMEI